MSAQNHKKLTPSPLVRKMSALVQPPCPCRHTINFKKPKFFARKSTDVRIWRTPSPLARTGQASLNVNVLYGRSLTQSGKNIYFGQRTSSESPLWKFLSAPPTPLIIVRIGIKVQKQPPITKFRNNHITSLAEVRSDQLLEPTNHAKTCLYSRKRLLHQKILSLT